MMSIEYIHPMVVHFPIVLAILVTLADAVALARGTAITGRGGYASFSAGLAVLAGATAALAAVFGDAAAEIAEGRGLAQAAYEALETHEGLGFATAAMIGAWALIRAFLWWRGIELRGSRLFGFYALGTVAAILVVVTAYFGGHLVYDAGVNVVAAMGSSVAGS